MTGAAGPKPAEGTPMKEGAAGAAYSQAAIADMVRGPYHQEIIKGGAGHVIGLPHILITGDTAVATSYSRLYRRDGEISGPGASAPTAGNSCGRRTAGG